MPVTQTQNKRCFHVTSLPKCERNEVYIISTMLHFTHTSEVMSHEISAFSINTEQALLLCDVTTEVRVKQNIIALQFCVIAQID